MTDAPVPSLDALPTLHLPPLPPEPPRASFPWIASAAPVAGAVAIWAITGSMASLAFAALGPIVAVAAMLDARRSARRTRHARSISRGEALARLRAEVARRHEFERVAAWRATPAARSLPERGAPAWGSRPPEVVAIGSGPVASRVSIDGATVDEPDALGLVAEAAVLADAPVCVRLVDGVGFVGVPSLARAAARAAILQVAEATGPVECRIVGPRAAWDWLARLPHRASGPGTAVVRIVDADADADAGAVDRARRGDAIERPIADVGMIAVAPVAAALPPGVRTVVEVTSPRHALVRAIGAAPRAMVPELMSDAEARSAADRLARIAVRTGAAPDPAELPRTADLAALLAHAEPAEDRSSLAATVGIAANGPLAIDLVDGPHALVAGTSGSGKSELLVAWLTAMSARYGPDRVAFLLVDFKGGAAFEPVRGLPHVTGLVTDLDEREAARAVESLRAELRHRERVLAASGVRSIADLPREVTLPRLVVVVDEFQAMIERFGELGAVVADVAARGRSLGVHLVLAAQRPNGIVREQVSANCGIRVSLRVLERADSIAVLGIDRAAHLDAARPGRGLVATGDGRVVEFQSALAEPESIALVAARHAHASPPRRPWLDPLPTRIGLDEVGAVVGAGALDSSTEQPAESRRLLLGVVDEPDAQRRSVVSWTPEVDGPLVVLGAPGSGRTELLDALAMQVSRRHGADAVLRLEGARSAVWDALAALRDAAGASPEVGEPVPRLVVVDDVDLRFAGWPDEHRLAALATVADLMRAVRAGGPAIVLSAGRTGALGTGFRDAAPVDVLLRHPSRADLVHAGGEGRLHRADAPPGAGQWFGRAAQFLHAERTSAASSRIDAAPLRLDPARHVALASARPGADADALDRIVPGDRVIRLADGPDAARRARQELDGGGVGDSRVIIVGDADAWAAEWSLVAAARARADLVVHGGGPELRTLAREAGLPPLLDADRDQCWRVRADRTMERAAWPPEYDGFRQSEPESSTDSVRDVRRN
ncbi:FtsK/SpoIIIE domain-containing protein [Agromyces sp. M3QZ16-3]|uniref:FtsK/SpoIIIE domain-containing protein n=1 Tax=Agromyces sp. M3QZ16-3 TaxID=3447585 RepID=UPI003F6948E9